MKQQNLEEQGNRREKKETKEKKKMKKKNIHICVLCGPCMK